jgi:predicted nucleic acid-binding protein
MESDVLVDSNVYIQLLNRGLDPAKYLIEWSGNRDLIVCPMVRLEVIRGLKSLKVRQALSAFMDVMVNVASDNQVWSDATALAWNCDRKGFAISGPDALIAASALKMGAVVLTSDAHFSRVDGLRVIAPPLEWSGNQ